MKGKVHIGTSGWHYPHWKTLFYPDDLSKSKWLRFYSEKLQGINQIKQWVGGDLLRNYTEDF